SADFGEVLAVHAREHGDTEHERRLAAEFGGGAAGGILGGAHHFRAAAGVDGEHLHVEADGGGDGLGDGVGDVVELEVEEDGGAGGADAADDVGTRAGEKFAADLEGAYSRRQLGGELQRGFRLRNIQRDNDRILHARIKPEQRGGTSLLR